MCSTSMVLQKQRIDTGQVTVNNAFIVTYMDEKKDKDNNLKTGLVWVHIMGIQLILFPFYA